MIEACWTFWGSGLVGDAPFIELQAARDKISIVFSRAKDPVFLLMALCIG